MSTFRHAAIVPHTFDRDTGQMAAYTMIVDPERLELPTHRS